MLYQHIAQTLQDISLAPRSQKADLTARLLAEQDPRTLCLTVRLLLGEVWPHWEEREMGIGPEGLMAALAEVSDEDVSDLRERMGEMGLVAEASLAQKGQHSLSSEPLQARSVYERLRHISRMSGKDSEQRKNALLRGLFLEATPLEGRFIARTVLGNTLAGIGHKTMLAAFSLAFRCDPKPVLGSYNLMPDPGYIASLAFRSELERIAVRPGTPVNLMIFRSGRATRAEAEEAEEKGRANAFLPKYHSLRVQVHKTKGETFIFTSRLRNITAALNGLAQRLGAIDEDFIIDADLIGFHEGKMCRQVELVRYINRRRLSRRSSVSPALLAYDLIYQAGIDTCSLPYKERRKRLVAAFGEPKAMPFQGISPAEESLLQDDDAVQDHLARVRKAGGEGLIARDLLAAYRPGEFSDRDFLIGAEESIAAIIIRAEYGRGKKEQLYARYRVALRSDDVLVPVGWAGCCPGKKDLLALSRQLEALATDRDEGGADVTPQVVLNLKIRGAHKGPQGYRILHPVIEEIRSDASWEDADELERLEKIYAR